jgi:hypothetical protein
VRLYYTVLAYHNIPTYIAETPHTRSITDAGVVAYNHIIPNHNVFSELNILANYYPFSYPRFCRGFPFVLSSIELCEV